MASGPQDLEAEDQLSQLGVKGLLEAGDDGGELGPGDPVGAGLVKLAKVLDPDGLRDKGCRLLEGA
eukprot:6207375-Lingulodinium_polyedra.AAC.1